MTFQKSLNVFSVGISISKLQCYGTRCLSLNLFKSYLANRQQYMEVYWNLPQSDTAEFPSYLLLSLFSFLLIISIQFSFISWWYAPFRSSSSNHHLFLYTRKTVLNKYQSFVTQSQSCRSKPQFLAHLFSQIIPFGE